jgi:hypothetical protein
MKTDDFRSWLKESRNYSNHTTTSRISNCKKVETAHGDLDQHFIRDKGMSLMGLLAYTTHDERENAPARHRVVITGKLRTGSVTLRQAVRRYMEFRAQYQIPQIEPIENYL